MLIQSALTKATNRPLATATREATQAAAPATEDTARVSEDSVAPARDYHTEQKVSRGLALTAGVIAGAAAGGATALLGTGAAIGIGAGVLGAIGVAGGVLLAGLSGLGPKHSQVSKTAGAAFYGLAGAGVGSLAGWLGGPIGGAVVGLAAGAAAYFGTTIAVETVQGKLHRGPAAAA